MSNIQLYMAPGTCGRVSCIALEQTGEEFETVLIRFMRGEHKSPEFKKLNPKGKVPALVIDDAALTENVAILTFLNSRYPDAKLLPQPESDLDQVRQLADLCFCAATLHPIVTRIRMPTFFAADDAARSVWQKGCDAMVEYFGLINQRLESQPWWYGDEWSVMDAYISWIFWRCSGAEFDTGPFSHYQEHFERMEARPSTQRAVAREAKMQAQLEAEGLAFTPPSLTK